MMLGDVLADLVELFDYNAFETWNVGLTLQVGLGADLFVSLSLDEVRLAGMEKWGSVQGPWRNRTLSRST